MKRGRSRPLSIAVSLTVAVSGAQAFQITQATQLWHYGGTYEHTNGWSTREEAAIEGASWWCGLDGNVNYFSSCEYGGLASDNFITIVTNLGSYRTPIHQYWFCPLGTQIYGKWTHEGVTYDPACVNWSASPPPPAPPPPPKVIAIDPGHGFDCAAKGMPPGAVGVTNFPPTDPPAGRLREDELTMAIAREVERILPKSKYRVVLTKTNVNECPSYKERGRIANKEEAKAFVSIHINRERAFLVVPVINWGVAHGTSVFYNVEKPESLSLAESVARNVSSSLGVNNRGVTVDDKLAVLKKDVTKTKNAVLVESARLSGEDETKLHTSGSATRIATGIKAALDESLGN